MPAHYPTLAAAGLAALLACSAACLALLLAKLRDQTLTALAAAAAACAAGYLASQALAPSDLADLRPVAAREVATTSFFIVFCGLLPWFWHRSENFKARPLLALTTASAALLLACNVASPYSLRYVDIALDGSGAFRYEPSGWILTLASLVLLVASIGGWAALQAWRRADRWAFVAKAGASAALAGGFFYDLALREAGAGGARLEGFGMAAMAAALVCSRLRGAVRFTHLATTERAQELDEALNAPALAILVLDQDGCVLKVDSDPTRSFRKLAGEKLWEHPAFSYDRRVASRVERAVSDMAGVSRSRVRTPCRIPGRGEIWIDFFLQRIADPDNGGVFVLAQARDVTQLKEQQEAFGAIVQARSGADESSAVIISRFSHELRTPLTPILGFADLLLNDSRVPHDLKGHAKIIRNSADALSDNISRLFDLTSSRREEAEPRREACETQRILDLLKREAEERLHRSGKELRVATSLCELAPPLFFSDETILLEALRKLLDNAIKFTASGQIEIAAELSGRRELEFAISDTGPGIAEDQLGAIFQPFYQDSGRGGSTSGMGIGLTLARCLAKQLGGDVIARSSGTGRGSCFALRLGDALPRFQLDEIDAALDSNEFERRAALLVEDDDATRDFLSRFLNSRGFRVLATPRGHEALAEIQARARKVDLLLLDMRLPDGSGLEVARAVREAEAERGWDRLPILAITAMAQDERDRELCLDAGCDAYIPKPIRASELLQKIDALMPQLARY